MRTAPHLAVPFRIVGGRSATVEQDTPDEITQCVEVILGTRPGERVAVPEFGAPDLVGQNVIDIDELADAVSRWEPRVDPTVTAERLVDGDPTEVAVTVALQRGDA